MSPNPRTAALIKRACKGKEHIKLTIGYFINGEATVKVFNETGEIQNENYIYEIASITKTFTASLLAKNIYENKMPLDDTINNYFYGLDKDKYYPTLKRLATHTAGYSTALPFTWCKYLSTPFKGFPQLPDVSKIKVILQNYKHKDKSYPWKYANFGFILLGHAIGTISGKGYWDAMDDFLSCELGLQNTYTVTNPNKNLHGFNKRNKNCGNYVFYKSPGYPSGRGDISSSAEDLLLYAQLNMNEEKPYLSLCHQKHAEVSSVLSAVFIRTKVYRKFDMGLGWQLFKSNNNILSHSGNTNSFSSYMVIDKDKKVACVVLSNYKVNTVKIGLSVLENLQNIALL